MRSRLDVLMRPPALPSVIPILKRGDDHPLMELNMEGGCTCRQVRYRLIGTPLIVHGCHCRWCQRETGTAHALNALYEADRVMHTAGEPEIVVTPSASGKGQKIARWASTKPDAIDPEPNNEPAPPPTLPASRAFRRGVLPLTGCPMGAARCYAADTARKGEALTRSNDRSEAANLICPWQGRRR
jgi:hypothetical protein